MRPLPPEAFNLIKSFEGLRLKAYQDSVGIWTIGYGATRWPDGSKVKQGDKITLKKAEELLLHDVARHANPMLALTKVPLTDNQYGALVSWTFNLGVGAFQRSTLRQRLNRGEYHLVDEEILKWDKAGGRRLRGLTRRRQAEADLFNTRTEIPQPVKKPRRRFFTWLTNLTKDNKHS